MPVIALLTDFGTADHYVGTMKGVMLGICPDATFVDITHEIAAQDVLGGALQLGASWRYFPSGTVFLTVVDPGVGSARRAIAVEAAGRRFVAPDNGLLTMVVGGVADAFQIRELTNPQYSAPVISRTFEGRDRFAPAAAWLARGVDVSSLGPPVAGCVRLDIPEPRASGDRLEGIVLAVDRFGNLITNIDRGTLERFSGGGEVELQVAGRPIGPIVETYADIPPGEARPLFGSSDRLEFSVNQGSAAGHLSAGRAARVAIRRTEPF